MGFERLTEYLDSLKEGYGVPGLDCQVMKDHQVLYRHSAGYSDFVGKRPVTGNELYDLYSCTKVVTMLAVMQLVEQGKIGLEDELSKYLPEFADMKVADNFSMGAGGPPVWPDENSPSHPARNKLCVYHLMSMTGGFSYNLNAAPIQDLLKKNPLATTREVVAAIAKSPLLFEPGTHWAYSLGHDIMAAVIEVVSGETFGQYLQNHIFQPLGIDEATLYFPGEKRDRQFAQHAVDFKTQEIVTAGTGNHFRVTPLYESGGAGLTASLKAYSTVLDAVSCGGVGANGVRILSPESIATWSRNWLNEAELADFHRAGRFEYGYGLGVRTMTDPNGSQGPVGEFGWDGAAGAYALMDPVNHVSVVYTQQVLGMIKVYSEIHPHIRDLVYEALKEQGLAHK